MVKAEYDIVIVGGGMVGASLACGLANEPVRVALIEAVPIKASDQPSYDDRGLALALSSQRILKGLKIWDGVAPNANPIRHIHVSDRGHFGCVRLDAQALGLDAMGYVAIARELGQVLWDRLQALDNVELICPAQVTDLSRGRDRISLTLTDDDGQRVLTGRLLVAADGAQSKIRQQLGIRAHIKDYHQSAIVTNITPQRAHGDTAYERFTETGPLALLPLSQQRCVMVCGVASERADHYLNLKDDAMQSFLQQRFGKRLGRFEKIGARRSYPLMLVQPAQQVADRAVLLGNSAHTIHPNGAQGFNLCLRDVAGLLEQLIPAIRAGLDPGKQSLLDNYLSARLKDQQRVIRFSDRLTNLFYNQSTAKVLARNTGMLITDIIPAVKHTLMRQGMGLWGRQPAMVFEA